MKGIALLGSTGSIGSNTLDVVAAFPDRFDVVGLAAGRNIERLAEQARRFKPAIISVAEAEDVAAFRSLLGPEAAGIEVVHGVEGAQAVVSRPEVS